jgi:hypothetical protein
VSAGTNCSGILTPGQLHAQPFVELLDLTGAIGLLHCSQSLDGAQCGFAAMAAIPIFGKGFKAGEEATVLAAALNEAGEASKVRPSKMRPAVSEAIQTPDGTVISSSSVRGGPPQLHRDVREILDSIPVSERGDGHGSCGFTVCLSEALGANVNPRGSSAAAVIVRGRTDHPMHGFPVGPCPSCAVLAQHYGITFVTGG